MKQSGQIVIILLLLMLVALSIALALTQRSVTDVTTSTQAEQATRAFSAAEAGIQKALVIPSPQAAGAPGTEISFGNSAKATIESSGFMPYPASVPIAIEYPKIGREITAHFWLADPTSPSTPPTASYNATQLTSRLELYYGNSGTTDLPAVEVRVVMYANNGFHTFTRYYDSSSARTSGANTNNFTLSTCAGIPAISTILGSNRSFFCRQTVPASGEIPKMGGGGGDCTVVNGCVLILARVRFLYTNENHSLALSPMGANNRFPPQVQLVNSVGLSGLSEKNIQAFKVRDVVLPWFDYAIFSTNEIRK